MKKARYTPEQVHVPSTGWDLESRTKSGSRSLPPVRNFLAYCLLGADSWNPFVEGLEGPVVVVNISSDSMSRRAGDAEIGHLRH